MWRILGSALLLAVAGATYAQDVPQAALPASSSPSSSDNLDDILKDAAPAKPSDSENTSTLQAPAEPSQSRSSSKEVRQQREPTPNDAPTSSERAPIEVPQTSARAEVMQHGPAIEEIVVTAEKREESINSVPIAISAFTGSDLQQLGVTDTRDLGKLVPGFTAADSGFSTPVYTLRGVGFNDFSYSATSTVGVYEDEVSLPYSVMTKGANFDLQRVEVLKGPQGTLYGRNTTGGTINYIANKPTPDFRIGGQVGYSRFDTLDADLYISGPLTETLKGRLAATTTQSNDGWQISNTRPNDRLGKKNKSAVRAALEWQPRDDLSFRVVLSGWSDRSQPQAPYAVALRPQNQITGAFTLDNFFSFAAGFAHVPPSVQSIVINAFDLAGIGTTPIQGTVNPQVANYPYIPNNTNPQIADWAPGEPWRLAENFWNASLRTKWTLNDSLDLTGLFSFDQSRSDGSPLPQSGLDSLQSEEILYASIRSINAELRLSGHQGEGGSINWLVGISGAMDKTLNNSYDLITTDSFNFPIPGIGNIPGLPPLVADEIGLYAKTLARSAGAFADGDWQFTDTLKLSQGVRYTIESRQMQGCTFYPSGAKGILGFNTLFDIISLDAGGHGNIPQGNPPASCMTLDANGNPGLSSQNLDEHNLSSRTALNWTPIDNNMFYASYARGYKSGGFPILLAARASNLGPVKQERLIAYEVGNKSVLWDSRLQINFSAFYYDYANKQLLTYLKDPVFGPLPLLKNAPKSMDEGLELTTTMVPIEGLYLTAIGSYIRTKIIEFESTTAQGVDYNFAGRPFNFAPRFQSAFIVNYSFPISSDVQLSTGADYNYNSSTNATLEGDPAYVIPKYYTLGAHAAIAALDNHWIVTAFCRNLTNEAYRVGVFRSGDSVAATSGFPRTYGLTFSYDYK